MSFLPTERFDPETMTSQPIERFVPGVDRFVQFAQNAVDQGGMETVQRPSITNGSLGQMRQQGQLPPQGAPQQAPAWQTDEVTRIVEAVKLRGWSPDVALRILERKGYTPQRIQQDLAYRTLLDRRQNYERDRRLSDLDAQAKVSSSVAGSFQNPDEAARNAGVTLPGRPYNASRAREELATRTALANAEAERLRNERASRPPLKQGYMYDPQDSMKQIPVEGGPAWMEQKGKHAEDMSGVLNTADQAEAAVNRINRILSPKNRGAFNSNFGGYNALLTQYFPGRTQDTRKEIEGLKSDLKAAGLNVIRAGGSSIGAITEREWPILEQMIDNLSPLMEEDTARSALRRISNRLQAMSRNVNDVYKKQWGDTPFVDKSITSKPDDVRWSDWRKLTPEERKLWAPKR